MPASERRPLQPRQGSRDRTTPYLAVLKQKQLGGAIRLHAGLAQHGIGVPFCDDNRRLFEFELAARDPNFALYRTDGWRHRYAEAFLELNHGSCPVCLETLYQIGREVGFAHPKGLK